MEDRGAVTAPASGFKRMRDSKKKYYRKMYLKYPLHSCIIIFTFLQCIAVKYLSAFLHIRAVFSNYSKKNIYGLSMETICPFAALKYRTVFLLSEILYGKIPVGSKKRKRGSQMDYNTFTQEILSSLKKEAGEQRVTLHRIEKNNGKILDAVTIMESGAHIAPTIYLADFYDFFRHGMSLEEVTLKILELNAERQVEEEEFQNAGFEDYKRARSHICYKLINFEMNRKLLNNVPYIPYLDLAVVFYYRLDEEILNGANFLVHNCHLETWGVKLKEIYEDAHKNTSRRLPFTFQGMEELIREMSGEDDFLSLGFQKREPMYILTNEEKYFGAAVLLYPHVLSHISRLLHCNYFVLPSSIHECILVPDSGQFSKKELETMVREVNETQVVDEEVLSHNVYYYDRKKDALIL